MGSLEDLPGQNSARDRRRRILAGARATFLRFGFDRSSIADIASEAGVTRTAIYYYFPAKDDILRAIVDELHTATLRASNEVVFRDAPIDAKLITCLELKFGQALALLTESPHGAEMIDAAHRLTGSATRVADTAFQSLVAETLVRHGRQTDADVVAETMMAAAKGLMWAGGNLVSSATYRDRITRLVGWIIS